MSGRRPFVSQIRIASDAAKGCLARLAGVESPGLEDRGEVLLKHWALPNFFFHITMAYALLRHAGVDLGKADFLATP